MGAGQSSMEQVDSFCKTQAIASKRCIQENEFDKEKYKVACVQQFQDYRDCKKRWLELAHRINAADRQQNTEPK
ncbi:hypothetical protein BDV3_006451 [Batrachochytrium dendrobatidis]|nr:Mitochondrial copper homeostasis protein [Batrachochytrium dendrobatidis]KAK5668811.1 Mitochondrial copper homeostasis protein [Batrachochytrium dendrobatidis]